MRVRACLLTYLLMQCSAEQRAYLYPPHRILFYFIYALQVLCVLFSVRMTHTFQRRGE